MSRAPWNASLLYNKARISSPLTPFTISLLNCNWNHSTDPSLYTLCHLLAEVHRDIPYILVTIFSCLE